MIDGAGFAPVGAVAVPLAGSLALLLAGSRAARPLALIASLATGAASVLVVRHLMTEGPGRYSPGGWGAPLGIDLVVDGLAVLMLLTVMAVGLGATGYALAREPRGGAGPSAFWPVWFLLWSALNALFLSGDIFNLYVTLELVTLTAVGLVATGGGAAREAALRYLIWAVAGSLAYLLGVALLYAAHGTVDLAFLGAAARGGGPVFPAALALLAAGLALKAALFPLHFWLPPAHAGAPPPVSALLSGLVVMAAFHVLLRLWTAGFGGPGAGGAGAALGGLGGVAVLWGAVQAFRQERLKLLVAYSTVAQMGYFFLCFGLGAGWNGAVYLAVSHACAKAALFLGAGTIARAVGHDRITAFGGVSAALPVTLFAVGMAGVTLVGLPPSGGFVGKWLLLEAALAGDHWWAVAVILAGSLAAAGYVFRFVAACFRAAPALTVRPVPRAQELCALGLAALALALGLIAPAVLGILEQGGPFDALAPGSR